MRECEDDVYPDGYFIPNFEYVRVCYVPGCLKVGLSPRDGSPTATKSLPYEETSGLPHRISRRKQLTFTILHIVFGLSGVRAIR